MEMRARAGFALIALAIGMAVAPATGSQNDLVVHEWGTFLSMNGSDGVTLDGMYHEEHALPSFVHSRSRDALRLPSSSVKSETPVIYFYAQQPQQVRVTVGFPQGIWTQWFPQARTLSPQTVRIESPSALKDGRIAWTVNVTPAANVRPELPATDPGSLWNHAREVDAAFVTAADNAQQGRPNEWERFIFYRGLGRAALPFAADVQEGGQLTMTSTLPEGVRHVFVLHVQNGKGAFRYVPAVQGKAVRSPIPPIADARPLTEFTAAIARDLEARLVETGLYQKEARAMVNTWRESYFHTDGIRVLFVLPQSWTDAYIPLQIQPAPTKVVRVMVGRMEVLTPERESLAERAVLSLASADSSERERAFSFLLQQGRYAEPVIRRTLATSSDEKVKQLARRLLATDFVKEIRATVARAEELDDPDSAVYLRAQLALVLRDVGLDAEAKQEGAIALAALRQKPDPDVLAHESRQTLRALARATEGAGLDGDALRWYADFVTFGSRSMHSTCTWCHGTEGPKTMTYFRDWWAGHRYGQLAVRTGDASRLIQEQITKLQADPYYLPAKMRLAYLYEARGDAARAKALWAEIDPAGEVTTLSAR